MVSERLNFGGTKSALLCASICTDCARCFSEGSLISAGDDFAVVSGGALRGRSISALDLRSPSRGDVRRSSGSRLAGFVRDDPLRIMALGRPSRLMYSSLSLDEDIRIGDGRPSSSGLGLA